MISLSDYYDPTCEDCKHYIENLKCKAFDRIPFEIFERQIMHFDPYPGDKGIQFEPKDTEHSKDVS